MCKNFFLVELFRNSISRGIIERRSYVHAICRSPFETEDTSVALRSRKASKSSEDSQGRHFVDNCVIRAEGGNGGDGCISLSSRFGVEFGGPDGGDGGNGAHVLFKASRRVNSLAHLKRLICGQHGGHGKSSGMDGKNSAHKIIPVPPGTIFFNAHREFLVELTTEGQSFLAARGGAGGKGNYFFRSSTNQTPLTAEKGGLGERFSFIVELSTMADCGLVGLPNVGKSTILRAISRARPKVAGYPFTTLIPHIGMVQYNDFIQVAVADTPGIIPDAHKNKGLGISFLRHVERCLCLLLVVDLTETFIQDQVDLILKELNEFSPHLAQHHRIAIVGNKLDVEGTSLALEKLKRAFPNNKIIGLSGKSGLNISDLLYFIRSVYDSQKSKIVAR